MIIIQNQLIWKTWGPSPYRDFYVHDPKKRLIQAPQFQDRIVHHALVRVVNPLFERKFIFDSYGCRVGKGSHAAMHRVQSFLRQAKRTNERVYVLKADVSSFFPSIDQDVLQGVIRRTIRCRDTLWLMNRIIAGAGYEGRGMPIGALPSQLFANIYLDVLDHFIKDDLRIKRYVRYMDDFIIIHHDKDHLKRLMKEIELFLWDRLSLRYNPKTQVFPYSQGIDFCGYRIWPTHVLPRKRNVRRARRFLKALKRAYLNKGIDWMTLWQPIASFLGYMKHCSGEKTLKIILSEIKICPSNPRLKS